MPIQGDGIFGRCADGISLLWMSKLDRWLPIVAETETLADRRNSFLKSRARISDGLARRSFRARRKNLRRKISALRALSEHYLGKLALRLTDG